MISGYLWKTFDRQATSTFLSPNMYLACLILGNLSQATEFGRKTLSSMNVIEWGKKGVLHDTGTSSYRYEFDPGSTVALWSVYMIPCQFQYEFKSYRYESTPVLEPGTRFHTGMS